MGLVNGMVLNVYFLSGRSIPVDMFVRLGACWLGSWCWFDVVVLRIAGIADRSSFRFGSLT